MYADRKGLPLRRTTVRLHHDRVHAKDCAKAEQRVGMLSRIRREIDIEGPLIDQDRQRLGRGCAAADTPIRSRKEENDNVQGRILRRRKPLVHVHQPGTLQGPDPPCARGPRVHGDPDPEPRPVQPRLRRGLPPEAIALKDAIRQSDAVLFVTPEYNRSIPGALKNAIDWASRPWGQNAFDHIPAAVIGASIGQIGTAVGQQSLRAVLSFCNAGQMTAPEAYIRYSAETFPGEGEVADESTRDFLKGYMAEFRDHVVRVLTVLPRQQQ